MSSARTEVAAAQLGGKVYVMGGYERNGDRLEEYDPVSDHWQSRASLPRSLHHIGAAAVDGKIYVIGGYVSGVGPVDTVYEYNPAADQWRSRAPMPTVRSEIAAASLNQHVFAFGGESDSATDNQTESYEPAGNKW